MSLEVVISAAFVVVFICYGIELATLISRLRSQHLDTWALLGAPNLMASNDQAKLLAFVFGLNRLVPYPTDALRAQCVRLRFYVAIGLMLFIPLSMILFVKKT